MALRWSLSAILLRKGTVKRDYHHGRIPSRAIVNKRENTRSTYKNYDVVQCRRHKTHTSYFSSLTANKQEQMNNEPPPVRCARNDTADDDFGSMQRGEERRMMSQRGTRHPSSTAREGTEEGCLSSGAAISLLCLSHPHNLLTTSAQVA